MYHYFPLDDDGRAPMPHIAFDIGGGAIRQYDLEFYANFGFRRGNPYFFSTRASAPSIFSAARSSTTDNRGHAATASLVESDGEDAPAGLPLADRSGCGYVRGA